MVPIIAVMLSWIHCVMEMLLKIVCGEWGVMEYCIIKFRYLCAPYIRSWFCVACDTVTFYIHPNRRTSIDLRLI